jgi:hypothetical protein
VFTDSTACANVSIIVGSIVAGSTACANISIMLFGP